MVTTETKADELRATQRDLIRQERAVQNAIARCVLEGADVTELRAKRADIREGVEDIAVAIERWESLQGPQW